MTETPLLDAVLAGQVAGVARAVSMVENARPGFEDLLSGLHSHVGRARRIGLTGPPGAGKSTLTERLVSALRAEGLKVAVVAVDPSSPFTGGALLGDRIRMESIALDPGVFIRSMASRGTLGGLATATAEVCDVLDAAGFNRILIETVGVGQSELDVTRAADSTILALVPESGDGIQALKAGLSEAADVFVINKSDRPGAERVRREVELALDLRAGKAFRRVPAHHGALRQKRDAGEAPAAGWRQPVLLTVASEGRGVPELVEALNAHWAALQSSGDLAVRRRARMLEQARRVVERAGRRWFWQESRADDVIVGALDDMLRGATSPYAVAKQAVESLREGSRA